MNTTNNQPCPCNPEVLYTNCCYLTHQNPKKAVTPEQLMRARYSAYVLSNIDFIEQTMCAPANDQFDYQASKDWADRVTWLGLKVISTKRVPNKPKGYVSFTARFIDQNQEQTMSEKSLFVKKQGQWFYADGKPIKA